jgi:hypothetical protein
MIEMTTAMTVVAPVAVETLSGATVIDALCAPVAAEKKSKVKKGRPFYAAVVVVENGVNAEITDAMAARVDMLCGKPNKTESIAWLKIAQQMVAGTLQAQEAAKK